MGFQVFLVGVAEDDLFELYRYVKENDSEQKALDLIENIEGLIMNLDSLPSRDHIPKELDRISVKNYREVNYKSYRVLYEIEGKKVNVFAILDGRRDLQDVLERRLLR